MTNIERVLDSIMAGHDNINSIMAATGLKKSAVHGAISWLRDERKIEACGCMPRATRYGQPMRRYRISDLYAAFLRADKAAKEAQEAVKNAIETMRLARSGKRARYRNSPATTMDRMRDLRQQAGVFAGLLA